MLVQHSVHIERPIAAVSSALTSSPDKWFPRLKHQGRAAAGLHVAGVGLRKKVAVTFGEPIRSGSWTEVPITWQATSVKRLFPLMVGKVELAPVDRRVTRLTVCGMYQPPLGRIGELVDDALMHNVAEATVKELAESIAAGLECAIRSGAHGPADEGLAAVTPSS